MDEDYRIGVYDTILWLNLSRESIIQACETDAPTCVQVFDLQAYGSGGPSANPHQSPGCRLCDIIESYASDAWDVNIVTYSAGENL